MPRLTIDGKAVDAAAGTTIIEAARANGIEIPHFCWHPRLSVSGSLIGWGFEMHIPLSSPATSRQDLFFTILCYLKY